jgi:GDPmannose 4,6-dehydratase
MTKKVVLITGITGQSGSFACELWLSRGYEVHGIIRRASNFNTQRIERLLDKINLHYGDITDMGNVLGIIQMVQPTMILNFAAMSHVQVSFEMQSYTFETNTLGVLNILQAIRALGLSKTRFYQASTSEMFGNVSDGGVVLNEGSSLIPVSPYGVSKLAAHHLCNCYRDAYDMFVVSSILFNHESERRGGTFVTKKIADHVKKYKDDSSIKPLQLGNLGAKRDWGYAKDYVYGIYLMMHHDEPDNYVLATGETHTVREFTELAFNEIGIELQWMGHGEEEYAIDFDTGCKVVEINSKYYRPIEVHTLVGDASKARTVLGWTPTTSFRDLVKLMVM